MPYLSNKSFQERASDELSASREKLMFDNIKAKAESLSADEAVLIIVGSAHHHLGDRFREETGFDVSEVYFFPNSIPIESQITLIRKGCEGKVAVINTVDPTEFDSKIEKIGDYLINPTSETAQDITNGLGVFYSTSDDGALQKIVLVKSAEASAGGAAAASVPAAAAEASAGAGASDLELSGDTTHTDE